MKNLTIIAISTIAGGLLATAGAGIAKPYTDESNAELLYAGLLGAGAGLILSATGLLVRKIYQACAREEMSLAASSSDAESSDGDECARYHLRDLLDSWERDRSEESLPTGASTTFYGSFVTHHPQQNALTQGGQYHV
jgi:hypothetical protein